LINSMHWIMLTALRPRNHPHFIIFFHRTQNKMAAATPVPASQQLPLLSEILAKVKFEQAAARLAGLSKGLYEDAQLWKALRNHQGPKGRTHLMHAAKVGNVARVRFLLAALNKDAQMEECTQWNERRKAECGTALMLASRGGTARHLACAQALVEKGAPVGAARRGDGATALMMASEFGHLGICQLLVGRHEGPQRRNVVNAACTDDGITALMLASRAGHLDVAKLLIEGGADVNAAQTDCGMTPLLWAAKKGHLEICKLLVGGGSDVNAARNDGITALMLACRAGHLGIAGLLLEGGANVNAAQVGSGMTALLWATASDVINMGICQLLVAWGADVNAARADTHVTPLMWAAHSGHLGLARLLLEQGAHVHAETVKGSTALIAASRQGHREMARLLMSNDGFPLQIARANREKALQCAKVIKDRKMEDTILKWSNWSDKKGLR
jgi:ankyrin repeat protein